MRCFLPVYIVEALEEMVLGNRAASHFELELVNKSAFIYIFFKFKTSSTIIHTCVVLFSTHLLLYCHQDHLQKVLLFDMGQGLNQCKVLFVVLTASKLQGSCDNGHLSCESKMGTHVGG